MSTIDSYQVVPTIYGIVPYGTPFDNVSPVIPRKTLTINSSGLHDTVAACVFGPIRLIDAVTSEADKYDLYTALDNNGGACVFAGILARFYSPTGEILDGADISDYCSNGGRSAKLGVAHQIDIFDPRIVKRFMAVEDLDSGYLKDDSHATPDIGKYVDISGGQLAPDANGYSQAKIKTSSANATKGILPFRLIGLHPCETKTDGATTVARRWILEPANSLFL